MNPKLLSYFVSVLLFLSMQARSDWWDDNWQYQKKLTIDISAVSGVDDEKEFPVLLKLSGGNFKYFMDVLPKGEDLRFVAADHKTVLNYHIEKFDPITEIALIWVQLKISAMVGSDETIYMYYGNPSAVAAGNSANTYDVSQVLVYHFDAQDEVLDATAYQNNPSGMTATKNPAGLIGGAASFTVDQLLQLPSTPSMQYMPGQGYSVSTWLKLNEVINGAHIISFDGSTSIKLSIKDGGLLVSLTKAGQVVSEQQIKASVNPNQWYQLGFSVNQQQSDMYIDGELVATLEGIAEDLLPIISIGKSNEQTGFNGMLDELRVANSRRSSAWFKTSYDNLAMGSDIVLFGADESMEEGAETESYFVTILSDVSLDGRIVIFLLGLMAATSAVVVFGKVVMLVRVKKDNKKFISAFRELTSELTLIDREQTEEETTLEESPFLNAAFGKHDHYQSSNLYHLYHVAMGELRSRVDGGVAISSLSMAATKATLDAAFVREQQVLNKSMVILTVAISGGPFLGLLGTVLGVMITFAAIATSGEIDINAIAPGVAAALMTTVAGLAVAIPALFSYNFLSTRIRDLSIDMRVFVDELIARISEYHGVEE